ncbi:M20 family metallo-hydrolase [Robertkochia aurantiaca]|uniref:M20 family metallo-hydrolase n=1 Tax=Robertkochia aurantiaca TaxID=2873700 RepID=UPI001CD03505|nr:M20 family metallo-hydrolase [Robertkochia sp. 3YJGBD-33]
MKNIALLFFLLALVNVYSQSDTEALRVDKERINENLTKLSTFGRDSSGHSYRVAFSDEDVAARGFVLQLMKDAGLETRIDYAGNIIGRRDGKDSKSKPIIFGSHIDMVPDGGDYDGCVGVMGAIEVIKTLDERNVVTNHPLEVILFANEEGGVIGSSAIAGHLNTDLLGEKNITGITMGEGIRKIGGNPDRIGEVAREKGSMLAFLELHIEQGAILENEQIDIGIVEGIVGIEWWDVTITGSANHAGTTPMNMRKDAMLAAAKFTIAVNEVINSVEGRQVGTVGRIKAEPGAPNVIPGKVVLSLEIRDLSKEKIRQLFEMIQERAEQIEAETGTEIAFEHLSTDSYPALTDKLIKSTIASVASDLGYSHKEMPSGAGHDAQEMAVIGPVGMIFIPSKGGISHSPEEYSSPEDIARGANVLLHTILELDQKGL